MTDAKNLKSLRNKRWYEENADLLALKRSPKDQLRSNYKIATRAYARDNSVSLTTTERENLKIWFELGVFDPSKDSL